MALSRRELLLSSVAAAALSPRKANAAVNGIAYVGSPLNIKVFAAAGIGQAWSLSQEVPSLMPAALLSNKAGTLLFAVNGVERHEGLARSTVESYAIDSASGRLRLVTRQPLSLSASGARHLALAPSEEYLVIPAFSGGIYNVIPVLPDGTLNFPSYILKDIGCGFHPVTQASSHPHSVVFHPYGKFLVASDFGCDRLTVFALVNGRLVRHARYSAAPGDGPGSLSFVEGGSVLKIRNSLTQSIAYRRFSALTGTLTEEFRRVDSLPDVPRLSAIFGHEPLSVLFRGLVA